jgi:uncharacterized protein (DUF952 family)
MKPDLLFHVLSKRKWREYNNEGHFRIIEDGIKLPIECVEPERLNEYMNEHFKGRKNLFVLVIVKSRVVNKIETILKDGFKVYAVTDGINTDAILDKIRIDCNDDGLFDLAVEEN